MVNFIYINMDLCFNLILLKVNNLSGRNLYMN